MGNVAVIHDEHRHRLETKLKRELGDQVLALLNDDRTEDVVLNPDSSLWWKRMGEGFKQVGEIPAGSGFECAEHDRGVAGHSVESRASHS